MEPYWPGLFAKLFKTKDLGDLISNVGAGTDPYGNIIVFVGFDWVVDKQVQGMQLIHHVQLYTSIMSS